VSRFKVNLQVMDDTGSITFIMFDRVVAQFIGRTAQDLLDAANRVNPYFFCVVSFYIVYRYSYIFVLLIVFNRVLILVLTQTNWMFLLTSACFLRLKLQMPIYSATGAAMP
jgi:hypothetical protein